MKPIIWLGDSLERVRSFPDTVRQELGFQFYRVQRGLQPRDWRPMPNVGSGVIEIRIHGENEYRFFYVARFREAIYVLHAFVKKTRRTRSADINLASTRLRELLEKETQK